MAGSFVPVVQYITVSVEPINQNQNDNKKKVVQYTAGKIAEKVVWRSAFWTIWHCILNADLTKTPVLLFSDFAGWVDSLKLEQARGIEIRSSYELKLQRKPTYLFELWRVRITEGQIIENLQ